jgi:hypothetical protein
VHLGNSRGGDDIIPPARSFLTIFFNDRHKFSPLKKKKKKKKKKKQPATTL